MPKAQNGKFLKYLILVDDSGYSDAPVLESACLFHGLFPRHKERKHKERNVSGVLPCLFGCTTWPSELPDSLASFKSALELPLFISMNKQDS